MPKYTSASDIFDTQIYHLSNSVLGSTTVNYWIEKAESEIDGYIAKQYTLPLSSSPYPPLVVSLAQDLTAAKLLKYMYSGDNQNRSEWVDELYAVSLETLEKIADDEIRLVYGSTGSASSGTSMQPSVNINLKTNLRDIPLYFNVDSVTAWHVPCSLLDSIDDDRELAD